LARNNRNPLRQEPPHAKLATLPLAGSFNPHAKYADVVSTAEILSYIDQLAVDLFDLPTGSGRPATPVREAAE
jgi:hypothetical protein